MQQPAVPQMLYTPGLGLPMYGAMSPWAIPGSYVYGTSGMGGGGMGGFGQQMQPWQPPLPPMHPTPWQQIMDRANRFGNAMPRPGRVLNLNWAQGRQGWGPNPSYGSGISPAGMTSGGRYGTSGQQIPQNLLALLAGIGPTRSTMPRQAAPRQVRIDPRTGEVGT